MTIKYVIMRIDERDTQRNPIKEETRNIVADITDLCECRRLCGDKCDIIKCLIGKKPGIFRIDRVLFDIAIEELIKKQKVNQNLEILLKRGEIMDFVSQRIAELQDENKRMRTAIKNAHALLKGMGMRTPAHQRPTKENEAKEILRQFI